MLGVCVGAALAGQRPIGEMQFNDFVATGFNQLVNNAAKIRYRWGGDVPMVVRMPWGGLRHAGPYHSQNTEPWFYRTPGLKIVVPSTPEDARALHGGGGRRPRSGALLRAHRALPRSAHQAGARRGATGAAAARQGRAAARRAATSPSSPTAPTCTSRCGSPTRLAEDGIEASVLDLRSLAPLDQAALLALARHCHRVLIVHEDARTGGIGESLAAIIQEEAFEWLDAPVRIVGALDTPVPYSPPLEGRSCPARQRSNPPPATSSAIEATAPGGQTPGLTPWSRIGHLRAPVARTRGRLVTFSGAARTFCVSVSPHQCTGVRPGV